MLFGETAPVGNSNLVEPLVFLRRALCLSSSYERNKGCRKLRMEGYAHHAYSRKGKPTFRSIDKNEVSIGSLDRLVKALDKAAKAGAIKKNRPIYLTEFGVQSYPDKLAGVPKKKQPEFYAASEHIAYVNRRVKAFSQYLMRDDQPRKSSNPLERYGGFETGLRTSKGSKKPAYNGFMLPAPGEQGRHEPRALGPRPPGDGARRRDDPARHGQRLEAAHDDAHRRGRRLRPGHDGERRARATASAGRGATARPSPGPPIRPY